MISMGKKSIGGKAASRDQRFRLIKMKMGKMYENKGTTSEITTSEVICKYCGFKVRYRFLRCPECNEVQK